MDEQSGAAAAPQANISKKRKRRAQQGPLIANSVRELAGEGKFEWGRSGGGGILGSGGCPQARTGFQASECDAKRRVSAFLFYGRGVPATEMPRPAQCRLTPLTPVLPLCLPACRLFWLLPRLSLFPSPNSSPYPRGSRAPPRLAPLNSSCSHRSPQPPKRFDWPCAFEVCWGWPGLRERLESGGDWEEGLAETGVGATRA